MNNLTLSELCFIVLEASWQPPNCANKTVLYFSRILSYAGHSKRKCTSSSTTVQEHFEHTRCCLGSLGRAHLPVLHEACKNRYDHVLPDLRTLIRKLEGVQVSCDAFLVTFDVVAMYPSIDNEEAIEAACEVVKPALRGVVHDLLHFVMDNSSCIRGENVHQQIHGTAMGTPCAVDYANIYVARCIEDIMRREFPNFPQH